MGEEIWRDIPGYEGIYQVSNLGRVKSFWNKKEKLLKPRPNKQGYLQVDLHKNNKSKFRLVHSLVMEAFVGPRPDGLDVCHNDGNRRNNHLDNLRYDTHSNNSIDCVKHKTHGSQKLSADDVKHIRKLLNESNLTTADIGSMYNIDSSTVCNIRAHRTWKWLKEEV